MQKFADAPLETHENCGGHVIRLISAPALQFKGSGWYVTDYARSANGKGEGKTETKSDAAEKKTGKKADSGGSTTANTTTSAAPPEKK